MLISFEGIDGSGKSTQITLLKEFLETKVKKVVYVFREPGGNLVSEKIRELLLNPENHISDRAELLLFSAARAQLVDFEIKPLLAKNHIVILDRFFDSTTAYQGFGRNVIPTNEINQLNSIATSSITPDITFYLRLSLEIAEERRTGQKKDRMESSGSQFYSNVIKGFEYLSKTENRFTSIDANQPIEEIHEVIRTAVVELL